MTEAAGAKPQEKPKSSLKPVRERLVRKELTAARHGATVNELAEEQAKGGGLLQQRAAVRSVSGDGVVSRAPALAHFSAESRFAHDFSRVRTHTVAPLAEPVVQAQLTVNAPGDRYEQEADQVAEAVVRMPEASIPGLTSEWKPGSPPVEISVPMSSLSLPIRNRIEARSGQGSQVPQLFRRTAEKHLGTDLSAVRIHADREANELAQNLQAEAFTFGTDVYLTSAAAQRPDVLGHELRHTSRADRKALHFWCRVGEEPPLRQVQDDVQTILRLAWRPTYQLLESVLAPLLDRTGPGVTCGQSNPAQVQDFFRGYPHRQFIEDLAGCLESMAREGMLVQETSHPAGLSGQLQAARYIFEENFIRRIAITYPAIQAPAAARAARIDAPYREAQAQAGTERLRARREERQAFQQANLQRWISIWTSYFTGAGANSAHAGLSRWLLERWAAIPSRPATHQAVYRRRFGVVPSQDDRLYMRSYRVVPGYPTEPPGREEDCQGLFQAIYARARRSFEGPDSQGDDVGIPRALQSHCESYNQWVLFGPGITRGPKPDLRPNVRQAMSDWVWLWTHRLPPTCLPGIPIRTRVIAWHVVMDIVARGDSYIDYYQRAGIR